MWRLYLPVKLVFTDRSLFVTPSDGDKSAQRHLHFKWRYVLWICFRLKISHFQCICYTQPPIHHWATWSTFVASWLCDWLWDEAFGHYVCTSSSLGKIKIQTRKVTFLMNSCIFHSIVALKSRNQAIVSKLQALSCISVKQTFISKMRSCQRQKGAELVL